MPLLHFNDDDALRFQADYVELTGAGALPVCENAIAFEEQNRHGQPFGQTPRRFGPLSVSLRQSVGTGLERDGEGIKLAF